MIDLWQVMWIGSDAVATVLVWILASRFRRIAAKLGSELGARLAVLVYAVALVELGKLVTAIGLAGGYAADGAWFFVPRSVGEIVLAIAAARFLAYQAEG